MGRPFEHVAFAACRANVSTGTDKRFWLLQVFPLSERYEDGGGAIGQTREHCLSGLIAAVITAAVLRHTLHVHAGFMRQEIAALAFAALAAVLVAVLLIQRRRHD